MSGFDIGANRGLWRSQEPGTGMPGRTGWSAWGDALDRLAEVTQAYEGCSFERDNHRDRAETLETALRELALGNPYDHEYGECLWCDRKHSGVSLGRPHDDDCPWLLARRLLGLST